MGRAGLVLALLLIVLIASGGVGSNEVPLQVKIAKHLIVLPPNFQLSWEEGADGAAPRSAPRAIVVETNDPAWMLTLEFRLPDGETRCELPGRWTCALSDARGELISEVFVKEGVAVLPGNGLCGRHDVQLRLSGSAAAQAATLPARLVVELAEEEEAKPARR